MKLLDRYVIFTFIKNYLISFGVLVGLYVVLDMIFNFDDILKAQNQMGATSGVQGFIAVVPRLADYYFHQSFLFFVHLSGVIPGIAAAFTLLRMTRFNELTAILAAGVPLLRVASPIIICAVILSALVVVDQEAIIPHMIPELTQKYDVDKGDSYPVPPMQDDHGGLLVASRFYPATPKTAAEMDVVDVIRHDEGMEPINHTYADHAVWDEAHKRWKLMNGFTISGLLPNQTPSSPVAEAFYQSNITPDEIALFHSGDFVDLLSISKIDQLLQRPQSYGMRDLLRVKHMRVAQWFMNVILLLLAIPAVLTRDPSTLKVATARSLALSTAALATMFAAGALAAEAPVGHKWIEFWPAMMAWLPIFIFGPYAVWLLDRVHAKWS
ncbi:MAG TPA: LptF/LptG family permease [Tepidisphaeraceae bacterium]|jgi:lipopolysaccharide export system permease protein